MAGNGSTMRRRGLLAFVAAASAVLGLTLVAFQNVAAICTATGVLCPVAKPTAAETVPDGWRRLQDEAGYARNWERTTLREGEQFAQVVTRFDVPMTAGLRAGTEVAPGEYVEIFSVEPDTVTLQVRVDLGSHWMLSRQTFKADAYPMLSGQTAETAPAIFRSALQGEIDEARFMLRRF